MINCRTLFFSLTAAGMLMSGGAHAQDVTRMPDYDVKAGCLQDANVKSGNMTESLCANSEFSSRLLAVAMWPAASAAVRKECTQWADYTTLYMCLASHAHDQ
jgi:hypothetical protein